jgi:hypothetical protein
MALHDRRRSFDRAGRVFHLVGHRFTLDESQIVGPVKNKLELIGRNLADKMAAGSACKMFRTGVLGLPAGGQQRRKLLGHAEHRIVPGV